MGEEWGTMQNYHDHEIIMFITQNCSVVILIISSGALCKRALALCQHQAIAHKRSKDAKGR